MNTPKATFTLTRTFQASREAVFNAFTTAEALAQWWGPVEAPIDALHLDFRVGGTFHYRMNGAQINYGVFHYTVIDPPAKLAWVNSFADEKGRIIKPPFADFDLPAEILNTITFTEKDGVTTLTLVSEAIHASEKEIETFITIIPDMEAGYGGTFGQLERFLTR